jgi:hypothetical protein
MNRLIFMLGIFYAWNIGGKQITTDAADSDKKLLINMTQPDSQGEHLDCRAKSEQPLKPYGLG